MAVQADAPEDSAERRTPSTMETGSVIRPTKTQVRKAAIGIITEFVMKSRVIKPSPIGCTNERAPYPSVTVVPATVTATITQMSARRRF